MPTSTMVSVIEGKPSMKLYSWNVNGIRAVHRKGCSCRFWRSISPISCVSRKPRLNAAD